MTLGKTPGVALYAVQKNGTYDNIVEYRWNTGSSGISGVTPAASAVLKGSTSAFSFSDSSPMTVVHGYDLSTPLNSLDIFIAGTYSGVYGLHELYNTGVGLRWGYGGVAASDTNIYWVSSAAYMVGSTLLP